MLVTCVGLVSNCCCGPTKRCGVHLPIFPKYQISWLVWIGQGHMIMTRKMYIPHGWILDIAGKSGSADFPAVVSRRDKAKKIVFACGFYAGVYEEEGTAILRRGVHGGAPNPPQRRSIGFLSGAKSRLSFRCPPRLQFSILFVSFSGCFLLHRPFVACCLSRQPITPYLT